MEFKKMTSLVAKYEGNKSEASIGDIRELFKVLKYLCADSPEFLESFVQYVAPMPELKKSVRKKK